MERLFTLQDRPLSSDKLEILVAEISSSGIPFGAIKQGLRKLEEQDLKSIKFFTIKDACKEFIAHDFEASDCVICDGTGCVSMTSDTGYRVALPCTCSKGVKMSEAQHLVRWNGARYQHSDKYGKLTLHPTCDKGSIPDNTAKHESAKEAVNVNWNE